MVAQNKEVAFIVIADGLQELTNQNKGITPAVKLAYLHSKLFNDNLVFRNDRQDLLKKLNNHFQQNWSMSQIKKGDVKLLENLNIKELQVVETLTSERVEADLKQLAKSAVPAGLPADTLSDKPVVLDDTTTPGSSWPDQGNQEIQNPVIRLQDMETQARLDYLKGALASIGASSDVISEVKMGVDSVTVVTNTSMHIFSSYGAHHMTTPIPAVEKYKHINLDETTDIERQEFFSWWFKKYSGLEKDVSWTVSKDNNYGWVLETKDQLFRFTSHGNLLHCENKQTQNDNSNTAIEETTMTNAIPENLKTTYESNLKTIGNVIGDKASPESRQEVYQDFLKNSETYRATFAEFQTTNPTLTGDELFFMFTAENDEIHSDFMEFLASRIREKTEPRARYSLVAEGDKGPRGCWIAAGAAVVGGGMEMVSRNGVTVGAAIGTLGAAAGSFFVGELIDKHIEHRYGRYVTAGLVGMAIGSVGAAVGRNLITGVQLPEFLQGYVGDTVVVAEVPAS